VLASGIDQAFADMKVRSLLFVPGDRPERLEKAKGLGADALILDLEDSVAPTRKVDARSAVAEFLNRTHGVLRRFVRINSLDTELADQDLEAVMCERPDALVLPKAEGAASIRDLDERLKRLGEVFPLVLPIATETPKAVFRLAEYAEVANRLAGLTWGAEDLSTAVGASASRCDDGSYTPPYEMVRSLALFGAAAAGTAAIETVFPAFRDLDGLAHYARRGMRDGFVGMMAIHPDQIGVINSAFTPTQDALDHAHAVVSAFEANPDAGVIELKGKMLDAPHLKQALRLLSFAED
jgi:citrate lyase subunit beta / citryl-CoA lyase